MIAGTLGFLVPRTRVTDRSAGCVHQSVAPTRASGRVAATASVREGTRETTRVTGPEGSGQALPRSSAIVRMLGPCVLVREYVAALEGPGGEHAELVEIGRASCRDSV